MSLANLICDMGDALFMQRFGDEDEFVNLVFFANLTIELADIRSPRSLVMTLDARSNGNPFSNRFATAKSFKVSNARKERSPRFPIGVPTI